MSKLLLIDDEADVLYSFQRLFDAGLAVIGFERTDKAGVYLLGNLE